MAWTVVQTRMMGRAPAWPALLALLLAGCAMGTRPEPRPPGGHAALRFTRDVELPGALGNTWLFPAGTVLVGDRRRLADDELLYCGSMTIRDLRTETRPTCLIRRGDTVYVNAEQMRVGFERHLPTGVLEEIRQ
ncbi:MAG: hypothetical protein AAGC69_15205 [Paracraurococcus sp.]|jgi:hypothetical protein